MDLFDRYRKARMEKESPLANRMRPRNLDEFVGQDHILAPGRLLRRAVEADRLSSLIFYGPPGTGKTTLAMVIANTTKSSFVTINAVLTGVARLRKEVDEALKRRAEADRRTTLFVDEVHRWNKAQQDALLPHVENGTIILIGATTENPYFEVNKALLSRSRIFQLKPLLKDDLRKIAQSALEDRERGYGAIEGLRVLPEAVEHLVDVSNGDARSVLNALELAVETTVPGEDGIVVVDLETAEESIQRRAVLYDKEGDVHYDTISAFIKSLRGSDPDAALYWMAKMVYAGEDPHFIFRRMAILASEDVGMADPQAAVVVSSLWRIFDRVGMPEGRYHLSQAALYLATCKKSNSTMAFFDALKQVREDRDHEVPNPLRDASRDSEGFGHGKGYLYPHAYRDHWTAQQYLPDGLQGRVFYEPSDQGYEGGIRETVRRRREIQLAEMMDSQREGLGEVLTNSPSDSIRDEWLRRAASYSAENLESVREMVFETAGLLRHHLVLDINAGSGLLSWEAMRRVPEGGVWSLVSSAEDAAVLHHFSQKLPELEKPVVMVGKLSGLSDLLRERGEGEVRFDRIFCRDLLTPKKETSGIEKIQELKVALEWLSEEGFLVLVQRLPRMGQRLHELVSWGRNQASLREKVKSAEERIFTGEFHPVMKWGPEDLARELSSAGFGSVESKVVSLQAGKKLSKRLVNSWFNEEKSARGLPGYATCLLRAGLDEEELTAVGNLYISQLPERNLSWRSVYQLVKAAK